VNISIQTDTGQNIKQLTGSEHPFVTNEANGDDIFMPVRQQTGYLRVLDDTGGALVEEILPENNTQKMVTLVNLTTGKTEWIGFLAAEVFTQPWGNEMTELEFPLKSALACLSDVQIQGGMTGVQRFALLVYQAFASLFGENEVPFTDIVLMDDFSNICDNLLIRANYEKFFTKEIIMNGNIEERIKVGANYLDALKDMCQCFGTTLRQQGTTIIFGHYDNGGDYSININTFTWDVLRTIANSTSFPEVTGMGFIPEIDLLTLADFRGNNNKQTFIPGGRAAVVNLELDSESQNIIEVPAVEITDGSVANQGAVDKAEYIAEADWHLTEGGSLRKQIYINWTDATWTLFNFQLAEHVNSNIEDFIYKKNTVTLTSGNNIFIQRINGAFVNSDAAYLMARYFFKSLGYPYYNYAQSDIATGALPGRYSKENGMLEDCLLIMQDVVTAGDTGTTPDSCYYIQNIPTERVTMQNCYINVNFDIPVTIFSIIANLNVYNKPFTSTRAYELGGSSTYATQGMVQNLTYSMVCRLCVEGSENDRYFWNGSSWVHNTITNFYIPIKGTSIASNYDTSMDIDNASGIFAKVENMEGRVIFEILNICTITEKMKIKDPTSDDNTEVEVFAYPFHKIITGLKVDLVYSREITSSSRSNNTYRQTIMGKGFSENKQIDLTFGTYNLNVQSPALLRTYSNDGYVQMIGYTKTDGTNVLERLEMHLLGRMVEYYKDVRRTMEAKIATGLDLFRNRFLYNGRKYMAIDKKHDWEREEQEVKFIEVD
jgi:hypothetical protein